MKKTFSKIHNVILASILVAVFYTAGILLPIFGTWWSVSGLVVTSEAKAGLLLDFLFTGIQDTPLWDHLILVAWSVSGSIYLVMLVHFFRSRRSLFSVSASGGLVGFVFFVFGAGCAACGTLLLTSLGLSSVGALVFNLPYEGRELPWLGVVFIIASIYFLDRSINKPLVC